MHAHLLNEDYLRLLSEHDALTLDGFPLPAFDEEQAIAFMDANGIERQLLSLSSPHPNFGNDDESAEFCARFNDWTAEVCGRHPGRFAFCAVVPLPDVAASVGEARRSMRELGVVGVKVPSNACGVYLGDPCFDPLFEEVSRTGGLVVIHPNRPVPMGEDVFTAGPVPLYEFLADTTRAVLNLIAHDVPLRYPGARIVVPHTGSFLPNVISRIEGAQPILESAGMMGHVDVRANLAKLYFDLAGNPVPDLLPLLASVVDVSHIVYGSDYPFTNERIAGSLLATLREFISRDERFAADAEAILRTNALGLL